MHDRMAIQDEIAQAEARLAELNSERDQLQNRISDLRSELAAQNRPRRPHQESAQSAVHNRATPASSTEKVSLFMEFFRGRVDVYPKRWVNTRKWTKGYSPACSNEWVRGLCDKRKVKCGECPDQAFIPVTDKTIHDHFKGRHTIGVYPMLPDETCWFLAVDFDKGQWQDDVAAFVDTCKDRGVPHAVERSRSGGGAHVWFFFTAPVPASAARKMGCFLVTETMARRHELPMASYDRFFPNQDTMPRGGFGNLIALPFQDGPRQQGNSVFIDESWTPFPDQWSFLASVRRMQPAEVEALAREAVERGQVVGVRMGEPSDDENEARPWMRPPSRKTTRPVITGPLPTRVLAMTGHEIGIFVAPPGSGKTVVGANLVARRRRSTLVLVHRTQLLEQWIARLSLFLDLSPEEIGQIGAGKRKPNGSLDVAMIQSLARKDSVDDIVATYGHVIVDECHHVPAVSFERIMREVKARYVAGLTATPHRRDGHHPILQLQLGPARFTIDAKSQAAVRPFDHKLIVRETGFRLLGEATDAGIQEIYRQLGLDERRNRLILDDVIQALEEGRSPILLTERRDHLELFAEQLSGLARNLIVLKGGVKTKERRQAIEQLATLPETEEGQEKAREFFRKHFAVRT